MTITINKGEMKLGGCFFASEKWHMALKIGLTLRFSTFMFLFYLNPRYLIVLLLLVLLILVVEQFQLATAREPFPEASLPAASASPNELQMGFRRTGQKQLKPKNRWEKELKDREYEKKIEEIFDRIRESSKDEYQQGINEIQALLYLRQQNLSKAIITKALR